MAATRKASRHFGLVTCRPPGDWSREFAKARAGCRPRRRAEEPVMTARGESRWSHWGFFAKTVEKERLNSKVLSFPHSDKFSSAGSSALQSSPASSPVSQSRGSSNSNGAPPKADRKSRLLSSGRVSWLVIPSVFRFLHFPPSAQSAGFPPPPDGDRPASIADRLLSVLPSPPPCSGFSHGVTSATHVRSPRARFPSSPFGRVLLRWPGRAGVWEMAGGSPTLPLTNPPLGPGAGAPVVSCSPVPLRRRPTHLPIRPTSADSGLLGTRVPPCASSHPVPPAARRSPRICKIQPHVSCCAGRPTPHPTGECFFFFDRFPHLFTIPAIAYCRYDVNLIEL